MAEDSQDCHVAGRTHAKKKNMENLEECHCVSARGQDGGQTIRVPPIRFVCPSLVLQTENDSRDTFGNTVHNQ